MTDTTPCLITSRYPVPTITPDGVRHSTTKMFLTAPRGDLEPRLYVYRSPDHCIVDAVWDPVASFVGDPAGDTSQPWEIATTAGVVSIRPGRGCAQCGRMARWEPPWRTGPDSRGPTLAKVMRQAREAA